MRPAEGDRPEGRDDHALRDPDFDRVNRLYELVENVEIAMLTTRRRDGSLVSRPMAAQRRAEGAHFWFVTAEGMPKLAEIAVDPNVNVSYLRERTKEWVSVSGIARIVRDREKIRELYEPSWKVWFPDEGGVKSGGPEDPRIVLIGIEARSAEFMTVDKPRPVILFEYLKSLVTGERPDIGDVEKVELS